LRRRADENVFLVKICFVKLDFNVHIKPSKNDNGARA
jgi:hypothetical protein